MLVILFKLFALDFWPFPQSFSLVKDFPNQYIITYSLGRAPTNRNNLENGPISSI